MVGTRDRVPHGIGLSSEISAGILAGGGPARVPIRFPRYPVFKVPGASSQPRPAASFRPRRKEIYYAHPPLRSRGFPAFFPGKGAEEGLFPVTTCGNVFRTTFRARTHSLHKPRKGDQTGIADLVLDYNRLPHIKDSCRARRRVTTTIRTTVSNPKGLDCFLYCRVNRALYFVARIALALSVSSLFLGLPCILSRSSVPLLLEACLERRIKSLCLS